MRHPHGLFGWIDLTTTDVEASRAFYTALFGWESTDMPTPMGPAYTQFFKDGKLVAGMAPQPPMMAAAGAPSTWNSYVIVDDVDAVCALVTKAGGSVVMPAMDVMTQGRMAMIADPSGAILGFWQPGDHEGAELFNMPGSLVWNELDSRDLEAATAFYAEVLGWRWEPMDDSGYLVAHLDSKQGEDTSNGGAMTMPDMVPAEAPSFWMVYLAVADCDESVSLAESLGGSVFLPAMQMGPGRFAGITDPTGGMFMLGAFSSA